MRAPGGPRADGEAKLVFTESGYQVVVPGTWVRCAVTGNRVVLEELRYWSARRQEPYANAAASALRMGPDQA